MFVPERMQALGCLSSTQQYNHQMHEGSYFIVNPEKPECRSVSERKATVSQRLFDVKEEILSLLYFSP